MTSTLPKVTANLIPAIQLQSTAEHKVLFVGQMLTAGTATDGELITEIENNNDEDTLFGQASMLAGMVRAAKKLNQETRFDAIPLDDATGTNATGSIAFSGTAGEDGTYTISIGSRVNYTFEITVTNTDTATVIGDALEAAVKANLDIPITASNSTGTVTLTCDHDGTYGNDFTLELQGEVASVTTVVTAMANGATDPTLTAIFDVIADERYQTIVWPGNYGFTEITAELDSRFNVDNDVLDGVAISSLTDTFANLKTAGDAENSASLVILGNKLISDTLYKGSGLFELNTEIAAQQAAIRALRLTDGANIAQFIVSSATGSLDTIGGVALSSLPYFNTPVPDLPIIDIGKEFARDEIEDLIDTGVSVLTNNRTRTSVIFGEMVTTRKTDDASNPDTTFKFLNNVDTSVGIRELFFNNLKSRFVSSRLTAGDLQPGRPMANAGLIRTFASQLFATFSGRDFVLTPSGEAARKFFVDNLDVTVDLTTGSSTIIMLTPIVVQLREIIATIQISFEQF